MKPALVISLLSLATSLSLAAPEPFKKEGIEFATPDGVSLLLDLHLPESVESPPLIMWIHGGGWKGGTRKNCKLRWAVSHGYAVASIEYRLSDEAIFPAQIHDCKGALRWLRANAGKYGYNAERVVVGGSSAGGHLAALMGTSGDVEALEGKTGGNLDQSSRVQGVIDYYGPTDFVHRVKTQPSKGEDPKGSVYRLFGGKNSERIDQIKLGSPVTHLSQDDPPFLILHGEEDKTVYLDQSELFHAACEQTEVPSQLLIFPDKGHGWKTPQGGEREAILASLKRWFASSSSEE